MKPTVCRFGPFEVGQEATEGRLTGLDESTVTQTHHTAVAKGLCQPRRLASALTPLPPQQPL